MNIRNYETKADLFQMLSHPVRLQIMDELRSRPACVCHLQIVTERPQAYISQQLRILKDADLVVDVKDGQNVFYHLKNDKIRALLTETFGSAKVVKVINDCTCPHCSA